jgi:protein arginine kinase
MSNTNSRLPEIRPAWISDTTEPDPVVLSTRVRLARNLSKRPFPHLASPGQLEEIATTIMTVVSEAAAESVSSIWCPPIEVSHLQDADKAILVDSHLVSLAHVIGGPHRIALIDQEHAASILVNEEDHLRIQTILPGLVPDRAWREADTIDDSLAARLPIAFHATFGYLTSSLANAGTGLRISVMLHLPALAFLERHHKALHAARELYSTIRGPYGEDGASYGHVYQISNSSSLGNPEKGIIGRLATSAMFLQNEENTARLMIQRVNQKDIETIVRKELSALESASALSAEAAMQIVSNLRLAQIVGIETHVSHRMFCEMITSLRGSFGVIARKKDRARDIFFEDTKRPAIIRNRLRHEIAKSGARNPQIGFGY